MKKKVLSLLQFVFLGSLLASCKNGTSVLDASNIAKRVALGYTLKDELKSTSTSVVYLDDDGQVIKINDPDDPAVSRLKSLKISHPTASMFYSDVSGGSFNETLQLSVTPQPLKASIGSLTWSSSDPSVASVDQNGLVRAVSAGVAEITATSAIGVSTKSRVIVNNNNTLTSQVTKAASNVLAKQNSEEFEPLENVYVLMDYVATKKCDGVEVSKSKFDQRFWISQPHSYFRIASNDEDIKTSGGSIVPSHSEYVFYTTEDYISYVFCMSNNKATYITLDQGFLVDEGKSEFEGLSEILQSFFVAGASVMTKQLSGVLSQSQLSTSSLSGATYRGTFGPNSGQLAYEKSTSNSGTVGPDDAADLGIPVGTYITINDTNRYVWEDYTLAAETIFETISYTTGGKNYVEEVEVKYYYQARGVELLWPNVSDFTLVESLFDL